MGPNQPGLNKARIRKKYINSEKEKYTILEKPAAAVTAANTADVEKAGDSHLLFENSGTLEADPYSLLDDDVFQDNSQTTGNSTNKSGSVAGGEKEKPDEDDPITKLHKLMATNFASIKTDSITVSGQLGLLQSNISTLNSNVDTVKAELDQMNNRLTNVAAQAVTNKCSIAGINKRLTEMQNAHEINTKEQIAAAVAKEFSKVRPQSTSAIPDQITSQLDKINKEMDKLRAVNTVQHFTNKPKKQTLSTSGAANEETQQYWAARKKLRISPVMPGSNKQDLMSNVLTYLTDILAVPREDIQDESVVEVRRVPGRRKNANINEVVVSFDTVQTRDSIASYAANLALWRGKDNTTKASLRLEIPDFLCGVFRVLERHAHQLKAGQSFFKRSIKFDDVNQTLFLDYCTREGGQWQRIHYEEAASLTRGRQTSHRVSVDSAADEATNTSEQENHQPPPTNSDSWD